MNILIIHNKYSQKGGEEAVVAFQQQLLEKNGHAVYLYTRDYNEMKSWWLGRIGGVFSAIYNPRSIKDLKGMINSFQPEIAILHNLYPVISPTIIPFLKKNNVRTIQILHNYRLFCPIGTFYTKGFICEKCAGSRREWNCLLNRCNNGSFFQSMSYTLRNLIVRRLNYFKSVEHFIALSYFQKSKFVLNGFDEFKISVIPNSFFPYPVNDVDFEKRDYIGFAGRLTQEKGIFDFIQLARLMPNYQFKVAGRQTEVLDAEPIPQNLKFAGFLNSTELIDFYSHSKVLIFPSLWYEGFPMTLLEAFSCKTPLIVYNLSVMPEIVEDSKEGFVVEVGDFPKMIEKVELLSIDKQVWTLTSENAQQKYLTKYTVQSYYLQLMSVINSKTQN